MTARVVLLVTTPRIAPGLLTREAWQSLEGAHAVWGRPDEPQVAALVEAGVEVLPREEGHPADLARDLVTASEVGDVVWVAPKNAAQPTGVWTLVQIPEIGGGLVAMDPHTGRVHWT